MPFQKGSTMRRNRLLYAGIVALAALTIHAVAEAADPRMPATVAAAVKSVADICTEVGGKALTADAVKRADLNGDGKEDYVLDVGSVNCDGAASIYGDREKGVLVYVGDGVGGAKEAFNDSVYGVQIEGAGPAAKVWLTVSAERCGKKPAKDFASENFCDRPLVWNAGAQRFDFAPVSAVRMIQ
jgi:hypothetical protein